MPAAPAKPTEQSEPTTDTLGTPTAGRPMLGQEDVQSIRRIEWRADDPPVRLRIDNKAARRYADLKSMRWEDFSQKRPIEQARMILEDANATPEQKQGVTILSDPQALSDFRRLVQPVMLTGCATSGCHGGANAKFPLIYPSTTDEAVYTNFYRLSTFKQKLNTVVPAGGIFGGATELNMIDRGNAARSLLMQYSFPPEVAEFDHPKVMNFEPVFQSMDDPRAKAVIDWIDRALKINPAEFVPNWDGGPRKASGTGNGK